MSPKAKRLLAYCKKKNRICPLSWQQMYELIPNKTRNVNGGWTPPLPLILASWMATTPEQKIMRLKEHIEFADANGAIDQINKFLRSLNEEQWYHAGE